MPYTLQSKRGSILSKKSETRVSLETPGGCYQSTQNPQHATKETVQQTTLEEIPETDEDSEGARDSESDPEDEEDLFRFLLNACGLL